MAQGWGLHFLLPPASSSPMPVPEGLPRGKLPESVVSTVSLTWGRTAMGSHTLPVAGRTLQTPLLLGPLTSCPCN